LHRRRADNDLLGLHVRLGDGAVAFRDGGSGFRDIEVQIVTRPDMDGSHLPMIETMFDYAGDISDVAGAERESALSISRRALAEGTYVVVAPQFVATGVR
jgi:hypothetical protein